MKIGNVTQETEKEMNNELWGETTLKDPKGDKMGKRLWKSGLDWSLSGWNSVSGFSIQNLSPDGWSFVYTESLLLAVFVSRFV